MSFFRSVFKPLVVRPVLREKTRTLLTILGIAVGVAVVLAIRLSNQSALRSFGESVDALAGEAGWQLTPEAGVMDESVLLALQPFWEKGIRFAPVIDADAILEPSGTPVRLLAVDLMSDLHFRDYDYASVAQEQEGAPAEDLAAFLALFSEGSVVVPAALAGQYSLRIGSTIVVEVEGQRAPLVVRGILRPRGPAAAFNGAILIADIGVAQQRFPTLRGRLTRVDLMVPEPGAEALVAEIAGAVPSGIRIEEPSQRGNRVDRMLRAFRVNLFALAGVALLVGIYLVYNTVLISILRRRAEVGILKTLGVTPRQIFLSFLLEGLLLGFAGGAIGVVLGWLMARATLGLIGRTVNALYIQSDPGVITLGPGLVLFGILLGAVVSAAAAIGPSLEAAAVRPGVMIRPGLYQRVEPRAMRRLLIGALLLLAASFAASRIPPLGRIAIGGYLSVLLIVAGFSLLAPGTLVAVSTLLRGPLTAIAGIVGRLAVAGVSASLRRTAVAVAALSVAIAMMVAVSVMVGSFRETVRIWVDQTVRSDLWLRPARALQDAPDAVFQKDILPATAAIPLVEAVDPVRNREVIWRDQLISLASADFGVARRHARMPMVRPSDPSRALDEALRTEGVLVSESLAIHHALSPGEVIELSTPSGMRSFPIAGVFRDYSSDRGTVMMDRDLYARLWRDESINTVAVYLREGTDVEMARRELERVLGSKYRIFAATNALIRTEVMRIFDQTFMITWSLLAIALLVAVVGIVNTLSALIMERRHELSLIRILGLSARQTRAMIVLESAIIGLVAVILGSISGAAMSWILIFVINRQSFGWTIALHPPLGLIAVSLAITFAATAVAGLLPGRFGSTKPLRQE